MANKTATAIHQIYLGGRDEPIKPGETFSADAKEVEWLIENDAAVLGKDALDHDGDGRKGGAAPAKADEAP
jgi:hypothetical protein